MQQQSKFIIGLIVAFVVGASFGYVIGVNPLSADSTNSANRSVKSKGFLGLFNRKSEPKGKSAEKRQDTSVLPAATGDATVDASLNGIDQDLTTLDADLATTDQVLGQ